jgi:hypothetical protein
VSLSIVNSLHCCTPCATTSPSGPTRCPQVPLAHGASQEAAAKHLAALELHSVVVEVVECVERLGPQHLLLPLNMLARLVMWPNTSFPRQFLQVRVRTCSLAFPSLCTCKM